MDLVQYSRALGLITLFAVFTLGGPAAASDRTLNHALLITATGNASKTVEPDQVTLQVTLSGVGRDVGSAVADLNAQKTELLQVAQAEGVNLTGTRVTALRVRENRRRRPIKILRDDEFSGTLQLSLSLQFEGDPLAMIAKLTAGRVDGITQTRFQVSDRNFDSDALKEEALADARKRAMEKAKLLQTNLGKLVNVTYRETPRRSSYSGGGAALTVSATAVFERAGSGSE